MDSLILLGSLLAELKFFSTGCLKAFCWMRHPEGRSILMCTFAALAACQCRTGWNWVKRLCEWWIQCWLCALTPSLNCSLPVPFSLWTCASKITGAGPRRLILGWEAYRGFKSPFLLKPPALSPSGYSMCSCIGQWKGGEESLDLDRSGGRNRAFSMAAPQGLILSLAVSMPVMYFYIFEGKYRYNSFTLLIGLGQRWKWRMALYC